MERLTFTATGTYAREIPVDLIHGLLEEIQRHMEGYGFTAVQADSHPAPGQPKTHCKKGHELTEANVIRNTEGFRECRRCKYDRDGAARKLKRARARKEAA
jgi:hypothetical protein